MAFRPTTGNATMRTSTGRGSRKVETREKQVFAEGKKLKNSLLIYDVTVDTITPLSLLPVKQLTSKALGKEIELHLLDCEDVRGPVARIIVCCGGGVILGAYELADYMSGVRANRICDDVFARLLGAFGRLPSVVEKKLVVLDGNRFAGSRVFPSTLNPDDVISVNPFA